MVPIRLQNLTRRFAGAGGEIVAVDDVSLEIAGGELFFLLGPSGCGKTTLLRMLAGFVEPGGGRVFFGGRDMTHSPPEKRNAAMVFQSYALWPHMTVAGNVAFAPSMHGVGRRRRDRLVRELLDTVRIAEKASAKPTELSGGQQQRVALARALAAEPACLLLDEPLSNLDAALRSAMRWEIRRIVRGAGITALYVTHDQAEAMAVADRIALMREGRIVQVGKGWELYERPSTRFVAEFLGEANFVAATVAGQEGSWLVLDTPMGRIYGRCRDRVQTGREVTCCIRPESLSVGRSSAHGACAFEATLTGWTHLGASAQFRISLSDGTELIGATMPARPMGGLGRPIWLNVQAEDVNVLTR